VGSVNAQLSARRSQPTARLRDGTSLTRSVYKSLLTVCRHCAPVRPASLRFDAEVVIHGSLNPLPAAEITFGCPHGNVAEKELNLVQFSAGGMAQLIRGASDHSQAGWRVLPGPVYPSVCEGQVLARAWTRASEGYPGPPICCDPDRGGRALFSAALASRVSGWHVCSFQPPPPRLNKSLRLHASPSGVSLNVTPNSTTS
jgi:hypothetical protein